MQNFVGILIWFVLPIVVGLLAIALPFRSYRKKKNDVALTLAVINSSCCGLSIFLLVGMLVFDWYPSFLPHILIGVGFLMTLVFILKS